MADPQRPRARRQPGADQPPAPPAGKKKTPRPPREQATTRPRGLGQRETRS